MGIKIYISRRWTRINADKSEPLVFVFSSIYVNRRSSAAELVVGTRPAAARIAAPEAAARIESAATASRIEPAA
jgi:hypothetical protein